MAPAAKRRKTSAVAEIKFDPSAREEYLTGFHKRKQARIKHGQEVAAKKEREEKIRHRKQLREERKQDLENHVREVNAALRKVNGTASDDTDGSEEDGTDIEQEFGGFSDPEDINRENEYVDEDKYTTVTVEAVDISKNGFEFADGERDGENASGSSSKEEEKSKAQNGSSGTKRVWTKEKPVKDKPKKKKRKRDFKYESKAERKVTREKQNARNRAQAKTRRG